MIERCNEDENESEKEFLRNLPMIPKSVLFKPFINNYQYRRTFCKEEDTRLVYLVNHYGKKDWKKIAEFMPFRSLRQCKERYEGYLAPNIVHDKFSPEEDMLIIEKYNEIGPKWTKISKFLDGRSGNQIKNRYNIYLKDKVFKNDQEPIEINEKVLKNKDENFFANYELYDLSFENVEDNQKDDFNDEYNMFMDEYLNFIS